MTTNARDEKWSEWIDWSGGECPLPGERGVDIKTRSGEVFREMLAENVGWDHGPYPVKHMDVLQYRYRIEEPTKAAEGMHPDLRWLAENVSEWNDHPEYIIGDTSDLRIYRRGNRAVYCSPGSMSFRVEETFTNQEWLQARKDLGLEPAWAGHSMTLYCDPEVKFGGVKVGGIRISHMTGIDKPVDVALTVTRGKRAPYRIKPLQMQQQGPAMYPPEKFEKNKAAWQELITSGKKTHDQVIAQVQKSGQLTEQQLAEIRGWQVATPEPADEEEENLFED